jgi:endonuclease-3 related protein
MLERHQLAHGKQNYEEIQWLFEQSLPARAPLFNEYHALIVHTGKHFCRKSVPRCEECALKPFLPVPVEARP